MDTSSSRTRCPVTETLRWWLAATVIGLIAVPYAFRLLRFLPDRGYTVARTLGILLVVYPLWLLSVLGPATYTAGSAVLILSLLALGAALLAGRDRRALARHLRAHAGLIVAAEVVFAVVLAALAALRAYAPAIDATEKLFEFGLLNGVLRSPRMPPADPWFGGEPMSYYYGGYLVAALFTEITAVPAAYGFNLGVALTGALAAVSVFGVGANLVLALLPTRLAHRAPRHDDRPVPDEDGSVAVDGPPDGAGHDPRAAVRVPWSALAAGLLSVVLLLVIGNLEGAIEFAAAHGWWTAALYQRLGIVNLTGLTETAHWYPDEFWFWWRATRMGSDWNIIEIPFFSFMLGDLHAHVMVLPFTALGLAALLHLLRGGERLDLAAVRRRPLEVLFLGVLAGMLALSNTWDQPVFLVLLFAAVVILDFGRDGPSWRAVRSALAFVLPVAALSVALYIPFFVNLHPASLRLRPVELNHLPPGVNGEGMVLPPHHFLIVWGPLLLAAGSGIVAQAVRRHAWRAPGDAWALALVLVGAPLALWSAAVIGVNGSPVALLDEVRVRATWWAFGSYWFVQLGVLALCLLGALTILAEVRRPHAARRAGRTYLLLTTITGLMILHGIELFYFQEPAIVSRINTLFKFSFIVWLLLAAAGGAAVVSTVLPWWRSRARLGPSLWIAGGAAVLLLALVYPVTAAMNRTDGFTGTPTLDGLAFLRAAEPDEYAALTWMAEHLAGRPTILEAPGATYSLAGRVSARTGFPTVIGWPGHEAKLRGGRDYAAMEQRVNARMADVDAIYRAAGAAQAQPLLRRYGVQYIYFGRLERERYGAQAADTLALLGRPVYRNPTVTLYRVSDRPPAVSDQR